MSVASVRAALRIARRDATRAKGRSALVLAMIGLPATAITGLAVLLSTVDTTPVEQLPWDLGTADAKVSAYGRVPVLQDPNMRNVLPTGEPGGGEPWRAAEVASALGTGTRLVSLTQGGAVFRTEHGYARAAVWKVDVREPLADGIVRMGRGRVPRTEDEVLVSRKIAERGFGIGATLRVTRDDTPMRVVGIAVDPHSPDAPLIVAPPDAAILGADADRSWLADTPAPVSWDQVRRLNRDGLAVLSRAVVHNPPPASEVPEEVRNISGDVGATFILVVALIVAMLLLEVVLLAGPAFAVGLRRQRRQLALVAVCGGDARHIRAVVLAGGLVLGVTAAVVGALIAFGLAAAAVPVFVRFGASVGPYEVPWPQVAAVTVVAVGSGLLAAFVPAMQAARMDVVAALGGRRGQVRTRRGWPVAGLVLTCAGVAATVLAVRIGEIGIVVGAVVTQLGLVVASPWIVSLVGRLAGRFPLPLRLAARDAARNRGRTAPAVAAITGAMAGVTALGIGVSSDLAESRAEYVPRAPMGTAILQMYSVSSVSTGPDDAQRAVRDSLRQTMERELPGVPILRVRKAVIEPCDRYGADCRTLEAARSCGPDGCQWPDAAAMTTEFGYVVGDESTLNALLGRDDPAAARALADGKAVVFGPGLVDDGTVTMKVVRHPPGGGRSVVERRVQLPAVTSDTPSSAVMLLPRSAIERLDASLKTVAYVVDPDDHLVTRQQEQRVREAVTAVTNYAGIYVERGFDRSLTVPLLLLAAAGGAMVLGGTLIATGLAAADSRPDLATLAAVGASPRTRRLLVMGQAAVVAVLGVCLGLVAGAVPGIAVTWPLTASGGDDVYIASGPQVPGPVIDIPWLLVGGLAVVLPLLAVLVAGVFTRSRLPLVRRIGG